jgi:hypothetical protein
MDRITSLQYMHFRDSIAVAQQESLERTLPFTDVPYSIEVGSLSNETMSALAKKNSSTNEGVHFLGSILINGEVEKHHPIGIYIPFRQTKGLTTLSQVIEVHTAQFYYGRCVVPEMFKILEKFRTGGNPDKNLAEQYKIYSQFLSSCLSQLYCLRATELTEPSTKKINSFPQTTARFTAFTSLFSPKKRNNGIE